jgi:hypothetical protein
MNFTYIPSRHDCCWNGRPLNALANEFCRCRKDQ